MSDVPVFGERRPDVTYVDRPSVYAIIRREDTVATVKIGRNYLLPGGGIDAGESDLVALARELREEIDAELLSAVHIGTAEQYYWSVHYQVHYRNIGQFYRVEARLPDPPTLIPEHHLVWLTPARAARELAQAFQRHAVERACELKSE